MSFLIDDCVQTEGRQLRPMDSPLDVFPDLKCTSQMAESWLHHHMHPLVITDTELAVLSETMTEAL